MGNWGTVVIPMLASMLILGAIGFAQEVNADVNPKPLGFWKKHPSDVTALINDVTGAIFLGDTTVTDGDKAMDVLKNAKSKDSRDALRAETLAAILNIANGASSTSEVDNAIVEAVGLLDARDGGDPIGPKDDDKPLAKQLKNILQDYNESGN